MNRTWLGAGLLAGLLGASSLGAAEPSQTDADSKPVEVAQGPRPGSYGFPRWDGNFGGYDRSRRAEEDKAAKEKDSKDKKKPDGPPPGGPGFGPWGKSFGPPFMRGPGGFGGQDKDAPKGPATADKKGPPPGKGPPWMRPPEKKEEPRSQARAPEKYAPEKKAPPWAQKAPSKDWRGGPPSGRPGFGPWAKSGHGAPPWAKYLGAALAHRFGHHGHHGFHGKSSFGRGPAWAHHGHHGKAKGHAFHGHHGHHGKGHAFGRGPAWGQHGRSFQAHHGFHGKGFSGHRGPSFGRGAPAWGHQGHKCPASRSKTSHGRGGAPWAHHHQGFRAAPPWAHSARGGFHGAKGPSRGPSWTGYRGYGHPGFGHHGYSSHGQRGFGPSWGGRPSYQGYHHGPWHHRGR